MLLHHSQHPQIEFGMLGCVPSRTAETSARAWGPANRGRARRSETQARIEQKSSLGVHGFWVKILNGHLRPRKQGPSPERARERLEEQREGRELQAEELAQAKLRRTELMRTPRCIFNEPCKLGGAGALHGFKN